MEVFCRLCPARIFGVTGSDGKTTTTTLIYKILEHSGYRCWPEAISNAAAGQDR